MGSPPSDNGRLWAALSYGGLLFGLPIGVIPLLQRDDPYALKHGKIATAVWLGVFALSLIVGVLYSVIVTVTCGFGFILFPIVFLPWGWGLVVGGHGLLITLNSKDEEPIGSFGLGEKLFSTLTLQDKEQRKLPPTPPPPPPPA